MIRFLNLKDQIREGEMDFAFYNTITNVILTFDGQQVFCSINDFACAYEVEYKNIFSARYTINRFIRLIPDEFKEYI